jgi:hypothetical protein
LMMRMDATVVNCKMDYSKIYKNLINRKVIRTGYVEKHHILPRCLGGTDDSKNLVDLYPEEHYLAHLLLCKIYPGNQKLLYAAMNMTTGSLSNSGKRNNKAYGWLRRHYAASMSGDNNPARCNPNLQKEAAKKRVGQKRTEETKARMSAAQKGRTFTEETKRKMAEAAKNRPPISEETRTKLKQRDPNAYWTGKHMSDETKAKMSSSHKGKKMSEEAKARMRIAASIREENKRKQRELIQC